MPNDDSELRYPRLVAYVREMPWAIRPEKLAILIDLLRFRAEGGRLTAEQIQGRIGAATAPQQRQAGQVAVIPIFGVIMQRADMLDEMSGATSTERIGAAFGQAVNDPAVSAIVFQIDSPGGGVYGVDELASQIRAARGTKPIAAVADSLAASAAYWIASAVDPGELTVTPSGEVGSIGVFAGHDDLSQANEMAGVKVTLISAGKYKVEQSPFAPLTDEARAAIQGRVDDYYGMFTSAVAKGRGVPVADVRSGFGEGRVVGAQEAVKLGMADRVATLGDTIARLSKPQRQSSQRADSLNDELAAELPAELERELVATLASDFDFRRRRLRSRSY